MQGLVPTIFLMIFISIASPSSCAITQVFDVVRYGAFGNGKTDDSQAFLRAWSDVCKASRARGIPTLVIPRGKVFLLKPVTFLGPCNSNIVIVLVEGTIIAPQNTQEWKDKSKWIQFSNIDGLVINGDGHIDGQGYAWWKSCFPNKESWGCKNRPTALHFNKCNGLQLSELSHLNSPRNHISISSCDGVHISHLNIFAPEESPNTDGIDISTSRNIEIKNSVIQTGDDCVAINQGSSYINISSVACGPGHGISIGSLGKNGNYETVEEVHVRDCNFTGTQNGARIKTWKGGSGYARKIIFENIRVRNSQNPIIIDQNYDPFGRNAGSQKAVKVSEVTFKNVRGTAAEELAIDLICSQGMGCTNILLDNIDIQSSIPGKRTYSRCNNVHGTARACNPVVPCVASS
ncbi:hypothetical protein I3843_05G212100 [Carya illinoinensis]|nr:hypothetical protein I3843_05G212100 [Carya illinoinensis]